MEVRRDNVKPTKEGLKEQGRFRALIKYTGSSTYCTYRAIWDCYDLEFGMPRKEFDKVMMTKDSCEGEVDGYWFVKIYHKEWCIFLHKDQVSPLN